MLYIRNYLSQNNPGVKKWPSTINRIEHQEALAERRDIEMGGLLLSNNDLTANIVILNAQVLIMLMASRFLIKMTRPQNIKIKNSL